jgi:hypothetical protein
MRVRLHRSLTTEVRKYFVGTVLNLSSSFARKLIIEGSAVEYKGEYPPKKARISLGRGENDRGDQKIKL